ncbi:MAG TPA: hypothetical protein VHE08_00380 [Solirubrobacterales bacterium]|nr:hypothetical protein [Solirubrobacterales bacterium]
MLRRHLTYANVVSTLCLFILLGGAAYAGTQIPNGSVGPNKLKAEAVTKAKLHANAVNSKKVVDGSLTGSDIDSSTLGTVPRAEYAYHAGSADEATRASSADNSNHASSADSSNHASSADNASHASSADNATNASNAANAEKLDGHSPSEFGPVLVTTSEEFELQAEAEIYFSVSGSFHAQGIGAVRKVSATLPGRKFRAGGFAFRLEGEAEAGVTVHVSLVVNETTEEEVCTLTVVPGTCTPSTPSIDIPAGAQLAWKIVSSKAIEHAQPKFALQLLPG